MCIKSLKIRYSRCSFCYNFVYRAGKNTSCKQKYYNQLVKVHIDKNINIYSTFAGQCKLKFVS